MNSTFGMPTTDNPRPFKCEDCKIAFRIHGHLAKHLRSKMHIMKLECLGKLPFGTYAEMERSGINLNEIDTTDCDNSLESLQVGALKFVNKLFAWLLFNNAGTGSKDLRQRPFQAATMGPEKNNQWVFWGHDGGSWWRLHGSWPKSPHAGQLVCCRKQPQTKTHVWFWLRWLLRGRTGQYKSIFFAASSQATKNF